MSQLITVGYSTRKHNPEFIEYLKKSSGFKKIHVIEKINNGEKSLSETYNEILKESETDIVVLCHDDIYFDTQSWYSKILKHFEKSDFGIIGVAGTTYMPSSGQWWEDRTKMIGIVNHEHEGKKWESKYSDSLENRIKETVIVDGLFIALHKQRIKKEFDTEFKGFHFYDIPFCFSNHIEGVKVGVITNIRITHKSIGMTNEQWEKNKLQFANKFSNNLPVKLPLNKNEKLKILIASSPINDINDENEFITSIINDLCAKGYDITILSNVSKVYEDKFKKLNVKQSILKEPPGFKIGDGKWGFNTPQGFNPSIKDNLYKVSDINFDFIIVKNKDIVNYTNNIYPNTNKIVLLTNTEDLLPNENDLIKHYFTINEKQKEFFSYNFELNNIDFFENNELFIDKIIKSLNQIDNKPKKQKIKILSGYSEKGGSTIAFINLTNELNKNGYDCTFYGPHTWHLSWCKSGLHNDLKFDNDDILICHYINLPERPNVKKVLFSLHEKNMFEITKMKSFWDKTIFLNESHKEYHTGFTGDFEIIPNLKEDLKKVDKPELDLIAGVIGTIDYNKQTHVSIQRALSDGCEKVYVFGSISDPNFYEINVKPLLSEKVIHLGHQEDKQKMYDMIGRVYHSSISECASLVKDECQLTGTKFFGNKSTNNEISSLTNEEVINKWIKLIKE